MTWAERSTATAPTSRTCASAMELVDLTAVFAATEFKAFSAPVVKAHRASPGGAALVARAARRAGRAGQGARREGPRVDARRPTRALDSPVARVPRDAEATAASAASTARCRGRPRARSSPTTTRRRAHVLGQLRVDLGAPPVAEGPHRYCWVTDFPLFDGRDDDGHPVAAHHPFTMPHPERPRLLETDPLRCAAQSYDLVLNGWELGSGSIRIHRADIQRARLRGARHLRRGGRARFGFLLGAFRYGAPPHGGFAVGLDRLVGDLRRRGEHPRGDRLPEDPVGRRPDDRRARRRSPTRQLAELGIGAPDARDVSRRDLFDAAARRARWRRRAPLAARLRPRTLDEVVGQDHLVGPRGALRRLVEPTGSRRRSSWGRRAPARRRSRASSPRRVARPSCRSAATQRGVKDVREALDEPRRERLGEHGAGHDPVPRRDPPLQQVPAGRAAARGRGRHGRAHRRDHGEPVLRAQRPAAQPLDPVPLRAARRRRAARAASQRGARQPRASSVDDEAVDALVAARRRRRARAAHTLEVARRARPCGQRRRERSPSALDDVVPGARRPAAATGVDEHYDQISALIKSHPRLGPRRRAVLARPAARGRRGPPLHRPAPRDPRERGHRDGGPEALVVADGRGRAVESSGCPRPRSTWPRRWSTSRWRRSRTRDRRRSGRRSATCAQAPAARCPRSCATRTTRAPPRSATASGYEYPHDDPRGWVDQQYLPDELAAPRLLRRRPPHGDEAELARARGAARRWRAPTTED